MKTQAKLISLLLAVLMLTALFAGCGTTGSLGSSGSSAPASQSGSASQSEPDPAQTPDEEPESADYFPLAEPQPLSMFVGYMPLITYDDAQGIAVLNYLAEATNVELDVTAVSMVTAGEQFNILVSSGQYPDILEYADLFYPGGCVAAYEDDIIVSLNDYLQYCPNYSAVLDSSDDYKLGSYNDNGDLLMFFCYADPDTRSTEGLLIRGDWLDELGLSMPATYDEYRSVLEAFKTEKGADAALWLPNDGVSIGYNGWSSGFGFPAMNYEDRRPIYNENGKVFFATQSENFRTYLETMNSWWNDGLIWKDFTSSPSMDPDKTIITTGSCGVWGGNITDTDTWIANIGAGDNAVAGSPYPVMKAGDINRGGHKYSPVSNMGMSISSLCENKELAARFMDFWYSEKGHEICNWGKLGETFEYDADGKPHYTDLILKNEMGSTAALAFYTIMNAPFVEDFSRTTSTLSDTALDAMDVWTETATGEFYMPVTMTLTTEENEEFMGLYRDIGTCYSESVVKFIIGALDLENDYDAFIQQLNDMGLERCIEIYQTAYDRYLARG